MQVSDLQQSEAVAPGLLESGVVVTISVTRLRMLRHWGAAVRSIVMTISHFYATLCSGPVGVLLATVDRRDHASIRRRPGGSEPESGPCVLLRSTPGNRLGSAAPSDGPAARHRSPPAVSWSLRSGCGRRDGAVRRRRASKSKITVDRYSVAHELSMSMTPLK